MAFNDEALKDGRGRAIRVDVSTDKFATIAYRWGDVAGVLDGTNQYSNRVLSMAPVRRGLGQNRVAGGGTCELVLANADGGLDALAGRESMSTQAKLRLRIYVCLYAPGVDPLTFTSKLLGEFSLTEWVRQDNETLTLPLGDDVMGAVSQQAALPTLQDWHNAGGSAATNPLYDGFGLPESVTEYTPVQLAFGEDWVLALPHIIPTGTVNAAYQNKIIVPICCTSSTAAASSTEITNLRIDWDGGKRGRRLIDVPPTVWDDVNRVTLTNWSVERSPTITKDGKTFKVIYLVVRADLGALSRFNNYITGASGLPGNDIPTSSAALAQFQALGYGSSDYAYEFRGGYSGTAIHTMRGYASNNPDIAQYAQFGAGVVAWYAKGVPLSARTQTTSPVQHPVDVLTDLVDYYSNNTGITVNATEGARVKVATASAACAGTIQPWMMGPKRGDPIFQQPPSLRQVITAICQSSDIDCFIDWSGQFSFAADFWDFTIATSGSASWTPDGGTSTSGNGVTTQYLPTVIPETWLAPGLQRWVPGDGERWSAFNRLWFNGAKAYPAEGQPPGFQGPWDMDSAQPGAIALADRIIEATLEQGWRPFRQQVQAPWFWRQLNIVARDMVRFRVHIGGLQLELGQYFALSWTRGPTLAGPYSGTIFQCEAITYAPGDDTVEVTAVWRNDVMTERQYVLDDETLIVRSKGALTGDAEPDPGGDFCDFTGTINLTTMGVVAGDILVLRSTSGNADNFSSCAAFRIQNVDSTTRVTVVPNFAAVLFNCTNAEWAIQRGATTYHTAVSDPTNYPLGGDRYGKVTNSSGAYSNAATGNRLISG